MPDWPNAKFPAWVERDGNDVVLLFSQYTADALGLKPGMTVELEVDKGQVVLRPMKPFWCDPTGVRLKAD